MAPKINVIKPWKGGIRQRKAAELTLLQGQAASSAATSSSANMPANAIEQKPVSKKRGRPPLHEDKGPQQSRVLKQHLRTKFLKNQVSAKDVHDDAVAGVLKV